jgi:hypothetical protein
LVGESLLENGNGNGFHPKIFTDYQAGRWQPQSPLVIKITVFIRTNIVHLFPLSFSIKPS